MGRALFLVLLVTGCSKPSEYQIEVEGSSPAVLGHELVEPIGIEALGGVFTPLLEAGCRLPCEVTQIFGTADDRQTEILVHLFSGAGVLVKDTRDLGTFRISGVQALPRGEAQVRVRISASSSGIILAAQAISGSSDVQVVRVAP